MEAALVGVAVGVMKPLLSKLSTLLQEKRAKHKSLERDTKFLRDEMHSMSAMLEVLADSEQLNGEMKIWRDNVRELSYDMEDCVDDFIARGAYERDDGPTGGLILKIRQTFKGLIPKIREKWKKRKSRNNAVSEIEQLKTRLIEASKRHKRYTITPPAPDPNTSAQDHLPLLKALYPEDELIGIDDPKEHIIEQLKEFQVVPIVGPGGLGKTTLANQVYNAIKDNFSCAAFVSVSRRPNMKAILRDLARSMEINHITHDADVPRLIERIREYLKDKRYFIVIDDVWGLKAWETISHALIKNDFGSRIITTTRNQEVASSSSKGGYVYKMRPLSYIDSKTLFFERAFGSEKQDYPHLQKVSSEILKKCDGLPLAIITIAGMLSQKYDLDEWDRVLAAIGSALAKQTSADSMTKILSLSYFDLPHHLKSCFLYLSLFPEDHIIQKDNLICRWIAEGFVDENQGRSTYEAGEGYFEELIKRSLIEPVDLNYGQAKACRVHDIVLDFITCKAAEENFATLLDVEENRDTFDVDSGHRVRRLCIRNRSNMLAAVPKSLVFSHVRSLTLFGSFMTSMTKGLFAFPYLRVLDMGEGGAQLQDFFMNTAQLQDHHLEHIEKLVFLRYLRFSDDTYITRLPRRIEDLQHLETLDICRTQIQELPPTISRLQRLARLRVRYGTVFPAGTIGQMKSLEELDCFTVSTGEQLESLQEFSQLSKLRKLIVYIRERSCQAVNIHSHMRTLLSACKLHNLMVFENILTPDPNIVLSMESWCPATPSGLRELQLIYCYIDKVPNWMSSSANLRKLSLSVLSIGPEDLAILGAIPTLLVLVLWTTNGHEGMILIPGGCGFRILNYFCLTIVGCGTSLLFESGSMPKLERLDLNIPGHKMECLNGASDFGINHLSALTKVEICIGGVALAPRYAVRDLVRAAIKTLPKDPLLSFERGDQYDCTLNNSREGMKAKGEAVSAGEIEQEAPGTSRLRVLVFEAPVTRGGRRDGRIGRRGE